MPLRRPLLRPLSRSLHTFDVVSFVFAVVSPLAVSRAVFMVRVRGERSRKKEALMAAIDRWSGEDGIRRREDMAMERARTAQLAHHLSSVALRQWEKALTGLVALPAAGALGIAASATYCVAMLERGFEVFESAVGEVGRSVAGERPNMTERHPDPRPEARA
jgi:hypothetical protein